ncbi:uncharacterized protein LOC110161067 [Boleophthalmus pectinirostris]|uniref:uncharacterized protein LOC110161067 n=1 Tax=Boleophthalmus pectinirostris TaxID=150288 RepID=UPI00242E4197|nr:uncharacterized protein LOC110161067 [Boleophthalmus pectinirostris]
MDSAPDAKPPSPEILELLPPPEFTDGEFFHVFVSYSSSDLHWTHALIQQLEDSGLKVCYHERDFTPGRSILENMSDCIQQSQKVLLVLSQEFVSSRWCLLEANMSMFRDCLQRKPIVPVLLQNDLPIPLHLSHLTYLEVTRPDFSQELLRVLCTPNHQLQNSTVVPYQRPNIYNGKVLQPFKAIDENVNIFNCGEWSTLVPDQLRLIIKDQALYREAINIINRVNKEKVRLKLSNMAFVGIGLLLGLDLTICALSLTFSILDIANNRVGVITLLEGLVVVIFSIVTWRLVKFLYNKPYRIVEELEKAACEANTLLYQEHILMGVLSNKELSLVYVSLEACRQQLRHQFPEEDDVLCGALRRFSSYYAYYLSKGYFPFEPFDAGHLEDTLCFCQYVPHGNHKVKLSKVTWD